MCIRDRHCVNFVTITNYKTYREGCSLQTRTEQHPKMQTSSLLIGWIENWISNYHCKSIDVVMRIQFNALIQFVIFFADRISMEWKKVSLHIWTLLSFITYILLIEPHKHVTLMNWYRYLAHNNIHQMKILPHSCIFLGCSQSLQ